ncbi:hypothetical protein [Lacrimispora sp. JR3]|uniref:hypothetical protein n=1 Tax=Lacrimispora sinapis TaxID=3111456 RepID=UPI00374923DA
MIEKKTSVWPFKRRSKKAKNQEVIGVIGTGRCVGVTHFAVMTAGYLSGVLRKRCAVLEWNSHGDFAGMRKVCTEEKGKTGVFQVLEVDYYEQAGINTLLLCKKSRCQTVIVDYGTVREGNLEEFLRCDRQFLLGSLSEWQMEAFLEFEGKENKAEKSWETFVSFGSEEARKNMEKRLKRPVRRIPVSVDAFVITGEMLKFYQKLF